MPLPLHIVWGEGRARLSTCIWKQAEFLMWGCAILHQLSVVSWEPLLYSYRNCGEWTLEGKEIYKGLSEKMKKGIDASTFIWIVFSLNNKCCCRAVNSSSGELYPDSLAKMYGLPDTKIPLFLPQIFFHKSLLVAAFAICLILTELCLLHSTYVANNEKHCFSVTEDYRKWHIVGKCGFNLHCYKLGSCAPSARSCERFRLAILYGPEGCTILYYCLAQSSRAVTEESTGVMSKCCQDHRFH